VLKKALAVGCIILVALAIMIILEIIAARTAFL
jgi:hypothetical protein